MKAECFFSSLLGKSFWFDKASLIDLHGTHSCLASILKVKNPPSVTAPDGSFNGLRQWENEH
jgi:hypothetical protein